MFYHPAATQRHRRIEWLEQNPQFQQLIRTHRPAVRPPPHETAKVKSMLDGEFSKCNIRGGPPDDDPSRDLLLFQRQRRKLFSTNEAILLAGGTAVGRLRGLRAIMCIYSRIECTHPKCSRPAKTLTWLLLSLEGHAKATMIPDEDMVSTFKANITPCHDIGLLP